MKKKDLSTPPQRTLRAVVSTGLAAGLALALHFAHLLDPVENDLYDLRARLCLEPSRVDSRIVIVLMDERTYRTLTPELGQQISRELYLEVARYCLSKGASVVAFDLLLERAALYPGVDDSVSSGLQEAGAVVFAFAATQHAPLTQSEAQKESLQAFLDHVALAERASGLNIQPPHMRGLSVPIEPYALRVPAWGDARAFRDDDGVLRKLPLLRRYEDRLLPAFPLAVVALSEGAVRVTSSSEGTTLEVGGQSLPLEADGSIHIRFHAGWKETRSETERTIEAGYPVLSMVELFDAIRTELGALPEPFAQKAELDRLLKGAIVMIGKSWSGHRDEHSSPVSDVHVGIGISAAAVDALLNGAIIRPLGKPAAAAVIVLGALIAAVPLCYLKLRWSFVLAPMLAALLGWGNWLWFAAGTWAPAAGPLVAFLFGLSSAASLSYFTEGRQRRWLKRVMQHYLPPAVLEEVLEKPQLLRLGGTRRRMTVMFCDLVGFTSRAEKLPPEEVVRLLNDHMSGMSKVIFDFEGTVDKFEGDLVMAFWNAPLDQADHALRACRAALRCAEEVKMRGAERGLSVRIGINTGEMVVGNMGSERLFDYTVIGDAVNLAARLEGLSRVYGTKILVGAETRRALEGKLRTRLIDRVRVKGKAEPVEAYEPLPPEVPGEAAARFESALQRYGERDWKRAAEAFERVLELLPGDGPSEVLRQRCRGFEKQPPPSDWDGVWEAQ